MPMPAIDAAIAAQQRVNAGFAEMPPDQARETAHRAQFVGLDVDTDEVAVVVKRFARNLAAAVAGGADLESAVLGVVHTAILAGMLTVAP
jgi:predicted RNA-binding protein YlxR (DUF448 family)